MGSRDVRLEVDFYEIELSCEAGHGLFVLAPTTSVPGSC